MRICLFGCGGFLGSHLVEWLLARTDAAIIGTDIDHEQVRHLLSETRFTYYDGDITQEHDLTRHLIETSDVVVDLVAADGRDRSARDPVGVFELHFLERLRIAQQCIAADTRLILLSSAGVYGQAWPSLVPEGLLDRDNIRLDDLLLHEDRSSLIMGPAQDPRWLEAASTQLLERALYAYGIEQSSDFAIIRPFNVLGPRFDAPTSAPRGELMRLFGGFMEALTDGTSISLVAGDRARRTLIYIDDAVECIGRIVIDQSGVTARQTFNVGNPLNETSLEELARLMHDQFASHYWSGPGELPQIIHASTGHSEADTEFDDGLPGIDKARDLLHWEPAWSLGDAVAASMAGYMDSVSKPAS